MAFPSESEDDRIDESPEVEQPDDNDRDVDVSERDGKTEVEVHRESRRERKQREFDERNQKRIEESLGPIRQQNEALQRQLAEFIQLQRQQPQQQVQQARQQDNGIDPDLAAIKSKQAALIRRARTAKDEDEADRIELEYRKLDQEAIDLRAGKLVDEKLKGFRPPPQMNYQEQQLRAEFNDVFQNPRAERYAASLVTQAEELALARGEQVNPMKVRQEALLKAAHDLGIRKAATPAPKPSQAARLSNRGNNAIPVRGNERSTKRTLTPAERQAAIASGNPELTPEQNIARWTKAMEKHGYWDVE
jgi:hypothetical protein